MLRGGRISVLYLGVEVATSSDIERRRFRPPGRSGSRREERSKLNLKSESSPELGGDKLGGRICLGGLIMVVLVIGEDEFLLLS